MATTTEEGIIKLDTIYQGSTFYGTECDFVEVLDDGSEVPVDLTGANIKIDMIKSSQVYDTYSSEFEDNSLKKLTITNNKFTFAEHIPTLPSGIYTFDIKVIFANEIVETGIGRGQWTILNPSTK